MNSIKYPVVIYRLQLNERLNFQAIEDISGYFAHLGVSHLQASPIFKTSPGGRFGYGAVDPNTINPDLGGREGLIRLKDRLNALGLHWIQDVVPNHMAFSHENSMLMDILEHGPLSNFYDFFDIDWNQPNTVMPGRVMAPFLSAGYAESLLKGDIRLTYAREGFFVTYGAHRFPLKIDTYMLVLDTQHTENRAFLPDDQGTLDRFVEIMTDLETLSVRIDSAARREMAQSIKGRLWRLYEDNATAKAYMDNTVRRVNGIVGNHASFRRLDTILSRQVFRLCNWRVAGASINYRRFIDRFPLISLRQEDDAVLDATHALLCELNDREVIEGVCVNHVDALADPASYLRKLHHRIGDRYLTVEKTLGQREVLPDAWPVAGTTGGDFAAYLNGLFIQASNAENFTRIYTDFTGRSSTFERVAHIAKRHVLHTDFNGELENLALDIKYLSEIRPFADALPLIRIRGALVEITANLPVYRTYAGAETMSAAEKQYVRRAAERSLKHRPHLRTAIEFIRQLLIDSYDSVFPDGDLDARMRYGHVMTRIQQLAASVMAKGVQNTALYRYHRLISLNEAGADPAGFGIDIQTFHGYIGKRAEKYPNSVNSTVAHGSKRGEDARARINVLSELPDIWMKNLAAWHAINNKAIQYLNGKPVPDPNEEYFLYQTLLGLWPLEEPQPESFLSRMKALAIETLRGAEINSSWDNPREMYEKEVTRFLEQILDPVEGKAFLESFLPFCRIVSWFGRFNALSQCLIKLTAPGVPDIYQGAELWNFDPVAPEKPAPEIFGRRRDLLAALFSDDLDGRLSLNSVLNDWENGGIKLFLIAGALRIRNDRPMLFREGDYLPLETSGTHKDHVIAFARRREEYWSLTVVPRFLSAIVREHQYPLGRDVWKDTQLHLPSEAPPRLHNIYTSEVLEGEGRILIGDILSRFPVALLV